MPGFSFPEAVQSALTNGMGTLIYLEARLQSDSGNINHQGINMKASQAAYVDFITRSGSLEAAALAMAGDIGQAVATGQLSAAEVGQLQGVLAELTGDAELAAEFVGQVAASMPEGYVDSKTGVGDNSIVGLAELDLNKLDQKGLNEFLERTSKVFSSEQQAKDAFRKLINNDFDGLAASLDFSTKKDCATFWSKNKEAARNYAKTYNGTIMEDTLGGRVFDGWQWINERFPEWGTGSTLDQKPLWESISRYYAMGVTGKVTVVHPENVYGDIYRFVEYKILRYRLKKGYVTRIEEVFHDAAQ